MEDKNNKKLSGIFNNSAVKGALLGAGAVGLTLAVLPVVSVSAVPVMIGAGIGAYFGFKNDK